MSILFFRIDPENIHIIKRSRGFIISIIGFFNDEGLNGFYELPKIFVGSQYLALLKDHIFPECRGKYIEPQKNLFCARTLPCR